MYTGDYDCLEVFLQTQGENPASVRVLDESGELVAEKETAHLYGDWMRFPLEKNSTYQVTAHNAKVSLAYLSGADDIFEKGIRILDPENGFQVLSIREVHQFFDTPYKEQYHFIPVVNWINDPNGLCWYQDYYHLFYQYNPFKQEWNNMYWGHAVSKDLVHWKHLPVVFGPQEEILDDLQIKGGAFSGCALPGEEEVSFYLTRHIGPQEDGEHTVQYQTMSKSRDMLVFEAEKEIIREKPEGVNFDFRDPKVGKYGKNYSLVLGGCMNGKGVILLYRSTDGENWEYHCPLVTVEEKIRTIECPDFFPLDGKYVAMGAWMCHYDEEGRYQMSRYYTGSWEGDSLQVEHEQWVDFGSNCYAGQTFEHEGRRIFIGWISDFYREHVEMKNGTYGSMTLPRVLQLKEGHVYASPAQEVYSLKKKLLFLGRTREWGISSIPGNQYYAKVSFDEASDFQILLGRDQNKEIRLIGEERKVFIKTTGVASEKIRFASSVKECFSAEIFVDRRTVEVYLNDGEDVGTKLFYNSSRDGIFRLQAKEPVQIELHTMGSIW